MPLAPRFAVAPIAPAPVAIPAVPAAPDSSSEVDRHDDEAGPRAAFRDPSVTTRFMLSGRAYLTFESQRTGTHFTYRIVGNKKKGGTAPTHFVGVLTRPDTYTYLGCVFDGWKYAHGRKSPIGQDAPSAKAFAWCWRKLMVERCMPETLEVFHEGRCGRCGRRLTTPESVARGLGEECERKMGL